MPEPKSKPKANRAQTTKRAGGNSKAPLQPKAKATPKAAKRMAKADAAASTSTNKKRQEQATGVAASRLIDERIRELGDWRGETLARMRALILSADPEMIEEWKWMGTPVWSCDGIVCTGETYKKVVKLTFAHGASIADPSRLFNSSLEGDTRRAIDIQEGEEVDAAAFKALVKAAVARNGSKPKKAKPSDSSAKPVKLLSGGNPQIAKGDGDAPVQAYIAAMPGWKSAVGARLDALIVRAAPNVRKAVKWNSPFYGMEGQGWFMAFHVFTHYVKVTFMFGMSLNPLPPGPSKDKNARYLDIRENDQLDEAQFMSWVKQAAAIPGWIP